MKKKRGPKKMHFCRRCGLELVSAFSKTKLCKHCKEKMKSSNLEDNKKLITDARHAKNFGLTYGEYRQLRTITKELEKIGKC